MPYTVLVSFDKFRENIELSGDNREIATKRKDIDFYTYDDLYKFLLNLIKEIQEI